MRLLHVTTGQPVVTFDLDKKAHFARPHLEIYFKKAGIRVPPVPGIMLLFPNKAVVRYGDSDFMAAFKEIYCKLYLQDYLGEYRWED